MKGQDKTLDVKHTYCCKQLFVQSIKSAVFFSIIWVKTVTQYSIVTQSD